MRIGGAWHAYRNVNLTEHFDRFINDGVALAASATPAK
jgi:hypothetical protein